MGECLITRRGGESYELPILNPSYPQNVTVTQAATVTATFSVIISTPGKPAQYTYQWYLNGSPISGATSATYTHNAYRAVGTYSVYCVVTNKAGTVSSRNATLTVRSYLPVYTYSGSAQLVDDGNFNWRLKLLTSGNLNFSYLGSGASAIDAFLVGGGGGGGSAGAGGGGGYTITSTKVIQLNTNYSVSIGSGGAAGIADWANGGDGGTSSFNSTNASGGKGGAGWAGTQVPKGSGGSGGAGHSGANRYINGSPGGSDGSNGATNDGAIGGTGQGSTTREFGESSGTLYAGGGGGGATQGAAGGAGGSGGGGAGGCNSNNSGQSGTPNTGGGGGGGRSYPTQTGGPGGSGIVIIRNHR